jgi:Putative peptidoglycan binding domain
MKTLLALICSFALVSFASAAQQDQDNNPKNKKEKGQSVQQPAIKGGGTGGNARLNTQGNATTRTAKFHTQATGTSRTIHASTINHGGGSLSSVQSTAKGTTFNKTTTFNKNVTVNKNVKVQHFNLGNQPSGKYQVVKFNQNFKIAGANHWQGAKYQVFVNYHPQWHDQGWWRSHHDRITFVFGAPYYWDSGYFYPAWGYNPGANYYYDGPIYASSPDMDPGQTVANVQAALQQQGYYQGEVDGVLGPQTRAALADYQSAQGLEPTGAIDEPTVEALGIA